MQSFLKYLVVVFLFISCSSAKNYGIFKVYESIIYTKQEFVGNIPIDDNGNPLQKGYWLQHIIVVEVKGDVLPKWENLLINGKENSINFSSINDTIFNLGKEKNTLTNINIYPKNGGKLVLLKVEDFISEIPMTNPEIFLVGKMDEKTIKIPIKKGPFLIENEVRP